MKSKVSIIVPTYNSEEFLDRVLINIQEQTYPNKELIVVDNFSTDHTPKIAKMWAYKFYQVAPERAAQMNYGIDKAKGDIIYVTGSDMLRDIDYVKEGVELIEQGYDAIYASVLTDFRVEHFWGRVKALERRCYIGTKYESARFFRKIVWQELGGFDTSLVGVEEDFQHRIDDAGYVMGRIKSREYHLHEIDNLKEVFEKYRYYGSFVPYYLEKHKSRGYRFLNVFRTAFFINIFELIKHPRLTMGLIIYKIVQYVGGAYGLFKR